MSLNYVASVQRYYLDKIIIPLQHTKISSGAVGSSINLMGIFVSTINIKDIDSACPYQGLIASKPLTYSIACGTSHTCKIGPVLRLVILISKAHLVGINHQNIPRRTSIFSDQSLRVAGHMSLWQAHWIINHRTDNHSTS